MSEIESEGRSYYPELTKIGLILEQGKDSLGNFDIVPVADAGFIVSSKRNLPMAGNNWCLFDNDDTLAAYTETKNQRLELYVDYCKKRGIEASPIFT